MHTVKSNPHTVKIVFQIHAMRQFRLETRPEFVCHQFRDMAEQFGTPFEVDGHVALVPLHSNIGGHKSLQPNDPVPVPGTKGESNYQYS